MTATTMVTIQNKKVIKLGEGYIVVIRENDKWLPVSKLYGHSTSAFAALGRLVQREIEAKS